MQPVNVQPLRKTRREENAFPCFAKKECYAIPRKSSFARYFSKPAKEMASTSLLAEAAKRTIQPPAFLKRTFPLGRA